MKIFRLLSLLILVFFFLFLNSCSITNYSSQKERKKRIENLKKKYTSNQLYKMLLLEERKDYKNDSIVELLKKDTSIVRGGIILYKDISEIVEAIHGKDNRIDYFEEKNVNRKNNFEGVALMVNSNELIFKDGTYTLLSKKTLSQQRILCGNEKFMNQPVVNGKCTAFAINDSIILTAGHCFNGFERKKENLDKIKFIFGYKYLKNNVLKNKFNENEVFSIKEIVGISPVQIKDDTDYAVIITKEQIPKKHQLTLSDEPISNSVYMIGHPSAIPAKLSDEAIVVKISNTLIETTLDALPCNSGSPVFDAKNNKVIGVFSSSYRGINNSGYEYITNLNCNVSVQCISIKNCTEKVASRNQFLKHLN